MAKQPKTGRKEPIVKPKRTFTSEFKRQVIEELLSGIATRAQISRKYNLSGGLINHWKEQYEKGKFGNEPTNERPIHRIGLPIPFIPNFTIMSVASLHNELVCESLSYQTF